MIYITEHGWHHTIGIVKRIKGKSIDIRPLYCMLVAFSTTNIDIEFRGHAFRKATRADLGIRYFTDIEYPDTDIDLLTEEEMRKITAEEI